jgi:hypothetical protein
MSGGILLFGTWHVFKRMLSNPAEWKETSSRPCLLGQQGGDSFPPRRGSTA